MSGQVDILALTAAENRVAHDLVALQAEYGDMPPDADYWRRIVLAAAPLFKLGGVEEGMKVLRIVPPAYLRTKLREHMALDDEFAAAASVAAHALVAAGRAPAPSYEVDTSKVRVDRLGNA